ncbi:hypothetical protein [Streptomyces sp. NPDC001292]
MPGAENLALTAAVELEPLKGVAPALDLDCLGHLLVSGPLTALRLAT